jgi:hypothetical protein
MEKGMVNHNNYILIHLRLNSLYYIKHQQDATLAVLFISVALFCLHKLEGADTACRFGHQSHTEPMNDLSGFFCLL